MKARVSLLFLVGVLSSLAFADVNLSINNSTGALEIYKHSISVATLKQGTISSLVKAGDESFRVSYGKDMNGMPAVVIYRDSSMKGDVVLDGFGNKVIVGEKSAVTISLDSKNQPVSYEAGALGGVTVADTKLESRQKYSPREAAAAAAAAAALAKKEKEKAPAAASVETASTSAPATEKKAASKTVPNNVIARISGTVEGAMKGAAGMAPLVTGDSLSEGSTIKTGKESSAVVQIIPGVLAQVGENTTIEFTKVTATANSGYDILLNVKEGEVICDIQNGGASNKILKVQTPEGVASAHGTNFVVKTRSGKTYVFVIRGVVSVADLVRGLTRMLQADQKAIVQPVSTAGNGAPVTEPTAMTQEDKDTKDKGSTLAQNSTQIQGEVVTITGVAGNGNGQTPGSVTFDSNSMTKSDIKEVLNSLRDNTVSTHETTSITGG